jgi:hypothetical protein
MAYIYIYLLYIYFVFYIICEISQNFAFYIQFYVFV